MEDTTAERLARVEAQLQHIERQEAARLAADRLQAQKIDKVLEELGRYKGFIGGVLFVCAALWAFIKAGIPLLIKLKGN